MPTDQLQTRLGLNVPYEWWPAASLVKSFEAAGFGWTQLPAPPPTVLADPRDCSIHARATARMLATSGLDAVVHGPGELLAGSPSGDRVFEGLLSYAAEVGAGQIVYHARNLPDGAASEDLQLAETRSLARLALRAEALGLTIAIENLAPVFASPEVLSHSPSTLRTLVRRISSPAVGICLDIGHAHVVADLRHSGVEQLMAPVLDAVSLFHLHDNLGARRGGGTRPDLDPLRLDLHLPPGRGNLPWERISPLLRQHRAPLLLEIHPPHRPDPSQLLEQTLALLGERTAAVPA